MQLRLRLYNELEGLALWKAPGLLFFPGTVMRRLSQESGQAASYFSGALFLLFHAQRQHDPAWPLPATHGWDAAERSRCGRRITARPSALLPQNILLEKPPDSHERGLFKKRCVECTSRYFDFQRVYTQARVQNCVCLEKQIRKTDTHTCTHTHTHTRAHKGVE